ncbi:metallophosphoesterase [Pseudorhodobacter turbinis]|uniref:Metallophosphoesterase n=2 Tax=Pseudorhodobacter turbinis TaxID=2500533 RepID=A0A4P8EDK5_9RHOB|nr:metallophosphoesterase [Pseudorhodobacter turbinis]
MLRSLNETLHSTRVFNESEPALRAALDEVQAKGITLVLILGDMTDDGQTPNWEAAATILRDYEARADMRFFLTPGNHDQWVNDDLAQTKEFSAKDGSVFTVSSTSDNANAPTPAMQRLSYGQMLPHASGFGFAPHLDDLLWETPFGTDPALEARMGAIVTDDMGTIPVSDLSYLVEPVAGLWVLSIDASVYWPDPASNKSGWRDGSSEGWAAVLQRKSWLLDWMSDVSARAEQLGKRLITFSHYPVLDVLNGASGQVDAGGKRRMMPDAGMAARIAATGIGLHFSGHWHLNRSATRLATSGTPALTNIATPSTVGYPISHKGG